MIAERATAEDAEQIAALIHEQQRDFRIFDDRLAPPAALEAVEERVRASLSRQDESHLVVRGLRGEVVCFGEPRIQELPEGHEWLSWSPRVGGLWESLVLPPLRSPFRTDALDALVAAARELWHEHGLDGETIAWPSRDPEMAPILRKLGLIPSFHYAYASSESIASIPSKGVLLRPARLEDYPLLWNLRSEQEAFHLQHCRFERPAPGLEKGFRAQFDRSLLTDAPGEELPQFSVAMQDDELVGFVEAVVQVLPAINPRDLPQGRYGYLANAAVRSALRGRGFGRSLVNYALHRLSLRHVLGFVLWYADDNPLSSRFWPRLGFRNLFTKYERRFDQSLSPQN